MKTKPTLWMPRVLSEATIARARRDYDLILNDADDISPPERIVEMSAQVDAIMPCHSERFTADVAARLDPRLKIIASHSVGLDHFDLPALAARGIVVTNTPDVLSEATAETAFLLMLGAARGAVEGDTIIRSGTWDNWTPAFMVGQQVTGQRLGIVGMGRIGRIMARMARGFGMEVHYHNRSRLTPELEAGAIYHATLDTLLPVSQFLSLHCPATPESEDLINAQTLAALPRGAIVINTARGALVDESALIAALESGHIAAAGLDCFKQEPGGNPGFAAFPNVFMLPHIGSATVDTRNAMGFRALDNLDAYFAGRDPGDRV